MKKCNTHIKNAVLLYLNDFFLVLQIEIDCRLPYVIHIL